MQSREKELHMELILLFSGLPVWFIKSLKNNWWKVLAERKKKYTFKWIAPQNKIHPINSVYYLIKQYRTLVMLPSHFKKQVNHAQVTDNTAALSPGFILNLIYLIQQA